MLRWLEILIRCFPQQRWLEILIRCFPQRRWVVA